MNQIFVLQQKRGAILRQTVLIAPAYASSRDQAGGAEGAKRREVVWQQILGDLPKAPNGSRGLFQGSS